MRNLFTYHNVHIPHEKFILYFFSDVHYGVQSCDVDRFKWFISQSQKHTDPVYYLGVGDYIDFAAFGDNRKLNDGSVHEPTSERLARAATEDIDNLYELLKPIKGRILGMIGGNHQYSLPNGRTSDQYLCELLDTKYLGWLSIINVTFPSAHKGKNTSMKIFACHGLGGGKLLGTSINKVVDMTSVIPNCDIYVMGHDHQRMATPRSVLQIKHAPNDVGFMVEQKRQYMIRSGSFQKSYVRDTSGFAQSKLMKPADLGTVHVNVSSHRKKKDGLDLLTLDLEAVV